MATTDDELYFVDTNILVAASDDTRSSHAESYELFERATTGSPRLFVCGQILREYLVVATRPIENNGLALSPKKAIENLQSFKRCIQLLEENAATTRRLEGLITKYKIKGRRIHDANIASVMIENGLSAILTLNPKDFQVFAEVGTHQP
ncbi:MAG TPA: type II toxin-antitoxin system VapC family toxin [Opitutales bacterium]|nr:type II toxin-antitoxin system VapC family toxin [Opitutales bacterium]